MRKERKKYEISAINSLINVLRKIDNNVSLDPTITDAPDCLINFDNKKIACECTSVTYELLSHFYKKDFKSKYPRRIKIPYEPHLWVRHAIMRKNKNVIKYRENTKADEVWLLLSGEMGFPLITKTIGIPLITSTDESIAENIRLIKYGAANAFSRFHQVWYTDRVSNSEAINIWTYNRDQTTREKICIEGDYHHVIDFLFGYLQITQDGEGKSFAEADLNQLDEALFLQPLDRRYQIDYTTGPPYKIIRMQEIDKS